MENTIEIETRRVPAWTSEDGRSSRGEYWEALIEGQLRGWHRTEEGAIEDARRWLKRQDKNDAIRATVVDYCGRIRTTAGVPGGSKLQMRPHTIRPWDGDSDPVEGQRIVVWAAGGWRRGIVEHVTRTGNVTVVWAVAKTYPLRRKTVARSYTFLEEGVDRLARTVVESLRVGNQSGIQEVRDTMATETTTKPKAAPAPKKCECGCGGETRGGRFLTGHDAKHKSNLIAKALKGGRGGEGAEAELAQRGWTKFLDTKRRVLQEADAAKAERDTKKANDAKAKRERELELKRQKTETAKAQEQRKDDPTDADVEQIPDGLISEGDTVYFRGKKTGKWIKANVGEITPAEGDQPATALVVYADGTTGQAKTRSAELSELHRLRQS